MDGDLDARARQSRTPNAVRRRSRGVKGIGSYAANHLLMLLGHYDQIPCDSEVRAYLGISPKTPQKERRARGGKALRALGAVRLSGVQVRAGVCEENYVDCPE